jgi:hypothetical protein
MRKKVLLFFSLLASLAIGQGTNQAITSTQCATFRSKSISSVAVEVVGTWTGTLQPQPVQVHGASPGIKPISAIIPTGTNVRYYASVPASTIFSVCGNTVTSGTAYVSIEQLEKNP